MTFLMGILGFFKTFSLKIWAYLLAFALVVYLLYRVYAAGGNEKEVQALRDTIEAVKKRNEIEHEVDGLSDDDVIKRLRDNGWFRTD